MQIRRATEDDKPTIELMGNKVLAHHESFDAFYKPTDSGAVVPPTPEKLIFLACDESGTTIGYIQGVFNSAPLDRSYPFAVIQSIWVEEVARGQGVAKQLIVTFETTVKDKGAKQIDMFVDVRNKLGVALWDAVGYATYQEKRRKLI